MFQDFNFMAYFRELLNNTKFQISSAISFGAALLLLIFKAKTLTLVLTILFLLPFSLIIVSLIEKIYFKIYNVRKRKKDWNNLTAEELNFVSYYIKNNTKTQYVVAYNGTYKDSGIINPLINKKILYIASNMSEFRGESYMTREQCFPFNIHDDAFEFFKDKK